jgi:hypothetical protein
MLPPENLFSTATNVVKVQSSTNPAGRNGNRSSGSNNVTKGIFTVAALSMLGLLAYGGGRVWMSFRKEKNRKAAYFGGDDTLIGGRGGLLVSRNAI